MVYKNNVIESDETRVLDIRENEYRILLRWIRDTRNRKAEGHDDEQWIKDVIEMKWESRGARL